MVTKIKEKVYVIGHLNPDTDSICSAIAYAYFLNKKNKEKKYIAARAGKINSETKFVLKKWDLEEPFLLTDATNQNVILVDHNEVSLAVKNIEKANILEIIDHHRIGDITTANPIPFENSPKGATATLITERFIRFKVPINKKIAGILLSAIISDTLLFKSPTTTVRDKYLAKKLVKIADVDLEKYGRKMLAEGCDIVKESPKKMILSDFKEYGDNQKIGIGQIPVIGFEEVMKKKEELLKELVKLQKNKYKALFLMVTDILAADSYLFFAGDVKEIQQIFKKDIKKINSLEAGIIYLPKVVSRKKQVQPKVLTLIEK